jgi:uncharacterized membrane protein YczE
VFAVGIVCLYQARLGLSPWDVLNQGINKHSPLSFGEANVLVGVTVLTFAAVLGARIGIGTVANAVLIGVFVDLLLRFDAVNDLSGSALGVRIGLLLLGTALMGIATGLYVGADFGAGPRDSLMLVLSKRTHVRIGVVRGLLEAAAAVTGFVLGGTVGLGTVLYVVAIGPAVEASFTLLARSPFAADFREASTSATISSATSAGVSPPRSSPTGP